MAEFVVRGRGVNRRRRCPVGVASLALTRQSVVAGADLVAPVDRRRSGDRERTPLTAAAGTGRDDRAPARRSRTGVRDRLAAWYAARRQRPGLDLDAIIAGDAPLRDALAAYREINPEGFEAILRELRGDDA